MKKCIWRKGSFTVEAAGIMGVVLLVIFCSIYGILYIHNQVWLTAAAYEAAISGAMEGTMETGDSWGVADAKGRNLGNTGFFGVENLTIDISDGKIVTVSYVGNMKSVYGGFFSEIRAEGSSKIFRPVSFIRNLHMIHEAGAIVKGE